MTRFVDHLRPEVTNHDHQVISPQGGLSSDMQDLVLGIRSYVDLEIRHNSVYATIRFRPDLHHWYPDPDLELVFKFEGAQGTFLDENGRETSHVVQVFLDFNGEVRNVNQVCGTIRMWPLPESTPPMKGSSDA